MGIQRIPSNNNLLDTRSVEEMARESFNENIFNSKDALTEREMYLKDLKNRYPESFSELQRINTLAKTRLLNEADFPKDPSYYPDSWSKQGLEEMAIYGEVPFGYGRKGNLEPYKNDSGLQGLVVKNNRDNASWGKRALLPGNSSNYVIRHEGRHLAQENPTEVANILMDYVNEKLAGRSTDTAENYYEYLLDAPLKDTANMYNALEYNVPNREAGLELRMKNRERTGTSSYTPDSYDQKAANLLRALGK